MRYWKLNADKTVERVYGTYEKPYPADIIDEDSVDPIYYNMDASGLIHDDGIVRGMTDEEAVALKLKLDAIRQANKSTVEKTIENNFMKLCQAIFGVLEKRGFEEINVALEMLKVGNFQLAVELGLKLSAVNQEGIREIGTHWWDDCAWHPEIEV